MSALKIPYKVLMAARLFASDRDIRYYLNGVCVEVVGTDAYLAATTGTYLGVFRVGQGGERAPARFIIPNEMIDAAAATYAKARGGSRSPLLKTVHDITLDYVGDRTVTLTIGSSRSDIRITAPTIDGAYPDWRSPIPADTSGVAAQFNADYIAQFRRAAGLVHPRAARAGIKISHNGEGAALVELDATMPSGVSFLGVLMPIRHASAPSLTREKFFLAA